MRQCGERMSSDRPIDLGARCVCPKKAVLENETRYVEIRRERENERCESVKR
jgi:hypothetical protein